VIYDTFIFWKELDLLELRLEELSPLVDRFVLVESPVTFTGLPKPLYYAENADRFSAYRERIIHVVGDLPPNPASSAWSYEGRSRNLILRGVRDADPSDTILLSDVDEIPDRQVILEHRAYEGVTVFRPRWFMYHLNLEVVNDDQHCSRMFQRRWLSRLAPCAFKQAIIKVPGVPTQTVAAGWHFSCVGDARFLQEKLASYSHRELNTPRYASLDHLEASLQQGRDFLERGLVLRPVAVDESFPEALRSNPARWRHLIVNWDVPSCQAP
jgi:beta-1,4-mannosyl-glycoprotein beta-1,4-N-acetylglucosaminyltransferase